MHYNVDCTKDNENGVLNKLILRILVYIGGKAPHAMLRLERGENGR